MGGWGDGASQVILLTGQVWELLSVCLSCGQQISPGNMLSNNSSVYREGSCRKPAPGPDFWHETFSSVSGSLLNLVGRLTWAWEGGSFPDHDLPLCSHICFHWTAIWFFSSMVTWSPLPDFNPLTSVLQAFSVKDQIIFWIFALWSLS